MTRDAKADRRTKSQNARILILVADDDTDIRQLLVSVLEDEGFATVSAADGLEAIDRVRRHHPDVVVLDLTMPRASGYDVLRAMRQCGDLRDIPVVVVSAALKADVGGAPVAKCITKPFDLSMVVEAISNAARVAARRHKAHRLGLSSRHAG